MLATVAPKHLLSRSDAYARPPALAPARGPASILRGVAWRNPARPRSSPPAGPGVWERRCDLAPVRRLELAPPPSDRDGTVRASRARAEGREGMGSRVEQFEQIRRDRDRRGSRSARWRFGMGCIAGRCGRRWRRAVPPERKRPVGRPAPKLGAYRELIDEWLVADRDGAAQAAAYRQADLAAACRGARRGWWPSDRSAGYVRASARELGMVGGGVRAAGSRPGRGGRGRLGRGDGGDRRVCWSTVHLFVMRACFSGAAFVIGVPGRDPAGVPGGARRTRSNGLAGVFAT